MTFLRMPAAQIFDGEELQLWQPVPGKRTLTQDLPVQRKAASLQDAAVVRAAISAEGSGKMAAAVMPAQHDGASRAAGPTEDPFALHLMSGGASAAAAHAPVVQRKALSSLPGVEASSSPEVAAPSGGGQSLPDALRAKMDAAFGFDFSSVRVHQGEHVGGMGALAYAQGSELHFAPGQYDPHSEHGQELIGHELAHVVQQSQGRVRATAQGKGAAINDDAGLEREADELGARAARGERVGGGGSSGGSFASSLLTSGGESEPVQMRALKDVAQEGSVVMAARGGQWMMVNGLDKWGHAKWHLTIFPTGQDSWVNSYKLPANGKRPVQPFMQFDEFHLTFEGTHFFYTDTCVPLAGSATAGGRSPGWQDARWRDANRVCAQYFNVDESWLNDYVTQSVAYEREAREEERMEQQHQERMWKRYVHWTRQCPEMYDKTKKTPEQWAQELMNGFQGTYQEFRLQILKEENECGGKLPDYPKRRWRCEMVEMMGEMVEVYGYEDIAEGGGGSGGDNKQEMNMLS